MKRFTAAGVVNCTGAAVAAGCSIGAATSTSENNRATFGFHSMRFYARALAASVVGAAHDGALVVVGVDDAVIGIATPIWRPDAGAIGATREMAGSLMKRTFSKS